MVRRLLDEKPGIANSHTKDAATPLMYASMAGNMNLVEILLEYGADINAKDYENGWTALMQGTVIIQQFTSNNSDSLTVKPCESDIL